MDENGSKGVNSSMSMYLEIPEFESDFRFRTFLNDGLTIVYPHVHKENRADFMRKRGKSQYWGS